MFDEIIKKELNKTIIEHKQNKIDNELACKKLDLLAKETKSKVPKGKKRELKNEIFSLKKSFKL